MVIYFSLDLINSISTVANTALLQPSHNSSAGAAGAVSLHRLEFRKHFKYNYVTYDVLTLNDTSTEPGFLQNEQTDSEASTSSSRQLQVNAKKTNKQFQSHNLDPTSSIYLIVTISSALVG